MRLDRQLKRLGVNQNQIDVFLANIDEHCFKKGTTAEESLITSIKLVGYQARLRSL
jgi:hypothetical protein